MQVQLVIFSEQKDGCSPADWEDGAGGGSFGRAQGGDPPCARFAVADGATETYDSARWANQLIASFMSPEQADGTGHPDLERDAMSAWFKAMQDQWQVDTPATSDYIEQLKIRQGTLATFVGGQLTGLDGGNPAWHAAALGNSVLFHVRGGRLITHLPALGSGDFDSTPEGISTLPGEPEPDERSAEVPARPPRPRRHDLRRDRRVRQVDDHQRGTRRPDALADAGLDGAPLGVHQAREQRERRRQGD